MMVGKRKAGGGTSQERQTLRLLSPKLTRLDQTVTPFHDEEVAKMSILPPNELIGLGSPILDIVMGYLDVNSLKKCRGVCKSWEDAARRALMMKCGLNVLKFFKSSDAMRCSLYVDTLFRTVRPSEQNRVELYSSWILEYNLSLAGSNRKLRTRARTNFLEKWGKGAKSLTLTRLTLDADCLLWIRRLLTEWCPNVAELNLGFKDDQYPAEYFPSHEEIDDFRKYLEDGDGVELMQILMGTEDHPFAPYPAFPKIQSLRVGKMSNRMTSFLTINILMSCPNLKHLFVSEQRTIALESYLDVLYFIEAADGKGGCRILHFLSKRPDITTKLETFEWQDDNADGCSSSSSTFDAELITCSEREGMPFLQFGNNLTSLHWNVLDSRDGVSMLFPGVLEQVAGNLRKLDLRECRTRPEVSPQNSVGCRPGLPYRLDNLPLPSMPKLSSIQMGLTDCCKVSLNELVDAARNLSTLEISVCRRCANGWMDLKVENIFHTLEQLNSLKRFKLTIHRPIKLYEILAGVAEAGQRMRSLESCHIHVPRIVGCSFHPDDGENRMRFLSTRTELLERILKTKQSAGKFIVTVSSKDIQDKMKGNSTFLLSFIKKHRLPIEFRCSSAEQQDI
jgi:hypothetical protein